MYEQIGIGSLERNDYSPWDHSIRIYETGYSLMEFNNWDYDAFYKLITNEYAPPKFKSYMPAHHYDSIVKLLKDTHPYLKNAQNCIKIGKIDKLDECVTTILPIRSLYMIPCRKDESFVQSSLGLFVFDKYHKARESRLYSFLYSIFTIDSVLELVKFKSLIKPKELEQIDKDIIKFIDPENN